MVRTIHVVAATALALTLAGCGGSDKSETAETSASTSSAPASTSAAAASDEQQIKDLVQAEADAFSEGDWDALAEMTCSQYREQADDPGKYLVPPIDNFGAQEQTATLDPAQLAETLRQQFGSGVSTETSDRVAQAIIAYDVPAYQSAMLDLMTESATMTLEKVENVKIDGDNATADVTMTQVLGDGAPETKTDSTPFVREDGVWLDCSPVS